MQEFAAGKFHFVLHYCNSHNGLHCLPALSGATGALGNFPQCLTARSALTAGRSPPSTTTHALVLLAGRRLALSRNAWCERGAPALELGAHAPPHPSITPPR